MGDVSSAIDQYLDEPSRAESEPPSLVVLMGGIYAGKTTLRREIHAKGFVVVDAAEIFLNFCDGEYFEKGGTYDEELNFIGKTIVQRAIEERRNIVTEVNGDEARDVNALVDAMQDAGYTVHVKLVECNRDIAWERNLNRGEDSNPAYFSQPYHYRWLTEAAQNQEPAPSVP